jgi:hypothetical protein
MSNRKELSMSVFATPRFLRNVLVADAVSCLATGALQSLLTAPLARLLHLPDALLAATGWFLLGYAALVGYVATRDPVPRSLVGLFVAGNFGWAAACIALLAVGGFAPTALGVAWVVAQAVTVAVLAELQWTALSRRPVARWA